MVILLVHDGSEAIIREFIVEHHIYVVLPLAEVGFGMIAVLVAVLEFIGLALNSNVSFGVAS